MPARAPTYYNWAEDKPCTTNQVYGFQLKDGMVDVNANKPIGPFDYTRPFSNSGFFPQISNQSALTTGNTCKSRAVYTAKDYCENNNKNKFDINKGYTMGYTPITEKIRSSQLPRGYKMSRSTSAPAKVHEFRKGKADNIYLWHTLAGNLVHVKNYPSEAEGVF